MSYSGEITPATIIALFGLIGVIIAFVQLRHNRNVNRARLALDLNKLFFDSPKEREFFYRLDYKGSDDAFRFDETTFPNSESEHYLDGLLYKLAQIGYLVRHKVIKPSEILWLESIAKTVLQNEETHKYLNWLKRKDQLPNHSSFMDAAYLHETLFGADERHLASNAWNTYRITHAVDKETGR